MQTVDLEIQLLKSEKFDDKLVLENSGPLFYEVIDEALEKRGMKRSNLILALNFDRNYGYQILNGTRKPTKKQIITIGLYLAMSREQIERLLKICGRETLYVRNMEDAKIIYALEHNYSFEQAAEFIWGKEYQDVK